MHGPPGSPGTGGLDERLMRVLIGTGMWGELGPGDTTADDPTTLPASALRPHTGWITSPIVIHPPQTQAAKATLFCFVFPCIWSRQITLHCLTSGSTSMESNITTDGGWRGEKSRLHGVQMTRSGEKGCLGPLVIDFLRQLRSQNLAFPWASTCWRIKKENTKQKKNIKVSSIQKLLEM